MHPQQEAVRAKCKEVFAKAKELYPHLNFDNVGIRFDLKGRAAGMACARNGREGRIYYMRFNNDMLTREAAEHIINDTVPHEIAHIICFMDPKLGSRHDYGWAQVCMKLGGSGDRCHKEEVVYAKGHTYEYTSTSGKTARISQQRHNKIQRGAILNYRNGGGRIDKTCSFTIVGAQGHTFKAPVAPTVAPKFMQVYPPNGDIREVKFVPIVQPKPTTLAKGANTGIDQMPPGFGKDAVINIPPRNTTVYRTAPTVTRTAVTPAIAGESKAATSRRIMLAGHQQGLSYETVIAQMMAACGYSRQLARGTYRANAPKIGIPVQ